MVFALIGYFVTRKREKDNPYKLNQNEEINLENIKIKEDVSLQSMVSKNKTFGSNDPNADNPNIVK